MPSSLGDLLVAEIGPFEAHAVRQHPRRDRGHGRDRLVGGKHARIGLADEVGRRIAVVSDHRIGAVAPVDRDHAADGNHLSRLVAGAQLADVLDPIAKRGVGLGEHLVGTAEAAEVVDVHRAQIHLQGFEQVSQ